MFEGVNNSSTIGSLSIDSYASRTKLYKSSDGKTEVSSFDGSHYILVNFEFNENAAVGNQIDFTINGMAVYEGAYCNPPFRISYDCSTSNPSYNDYVSPITYNLSFNINNRLQSKWTRIFLVSKTNFRMYSNYTINILGNPHANFTNFLRIFINGVAGIQSYHMSIIDKFKGYYKTDGSIDGVSALQKVRLAYDNDNNIFFEAYSSNPTTSFTYYIFSMKSEINYGSYNINLQRIRYYNSEGHRWWALDGSSDMLYCPAHEISLSYT